MSLQHGLGFSVGGSTPAPSVAPAEKVTVEHARITSTPGFLAVAADGEVNRGRWSIGPAQLILMAKRLRAAAEPSWIVGDPDYAKDCPTNAPNGGEVFEDGGHTLRVPAPFRFYAIRDDYHGDNGAADEITHQIVTFMLPEEY